MQGESRAKLVFDYAEPQPIMGKSKQEGKKPSDGAASGEAEPTTNREPSSLLEWPRCEGGRRSQLLRLSRVAREQGEAKH